MENKQFSETLPVTKRVLAIAIGMRPEVESQTGQKHKVYAAVEYRSKAEKGTLYYIKIFVGSEKYIVIKVLWSIGNRFKLKGVKTNFDLSDKIDEFESNIYSLHDVVSPQIATKLMQEIADSVKPDVEEKTEQTFNTYDVLTYRDEFKGVSPEEHVTMLFHIWVVVSDLRNLCLTVQFCTSDNKPRLIQANFI
ncbi:unnamed protein product [Clavelina lepadiformis]|uniref:Cystatin domain-containing protein n=1 Tax=Clavelina lepadiformis TaxID=159417 RepID=A0ABP0GUT1_CLALP